MFYIPKKPESSKVKNKNKNNNWLPARTIMFSFLIVIAVGALLLMLPISSRPGIKTGFMDALFTATSATCVTGLVTVDTATHWSTFGQCVILLLIQIGGLGLVTLVSFFNIMMKRRIGLRSLQLARESISTNDFGDVNILVRFIVVLSLTIEGVGALLLMMTLCPMYGPKGIFYSIFLSISSFCNAGFDPFGFEIPFCSLTILSNNAFFLIVIMMLIIIGGTGFGVWSNVLSFKNSRHLTLHTKIVLSTTALMIIGGSIGICIFEWSNPATIGGMNPFHKILNFLFLSVSSRTAGFNTFDLNSMRGTTKLFVCALMFVGAAPGSTGGGIKITTMVVLVSTVWCALRGLSEVYIHKHQIKKTTVYKSLAIATLALLVCILACIGVAQSHKNTGIPIWGVDAFFETISAFGTVGLSVGVTGHAPVLAKLALIFTMFFGRVGPVSFALALAARPHTARALIRPEGKIMVG